MPDISTNLGLNLPKGTDTFDYDLYLRQNFQKIDDNAASTAASLADITTKRLQFVTYKQFGAKLDGVTDDTAAIKACHDYANSNNLPVIQQGGLIYITDTIVVKTSTDLTGCTLVLNNVAQNGKTLYEIDSIYAEETVTTFTQSEFKKGATVFPSLASYKNCFIRIDSADLACVRNDGGNLSNIYKKDSLVLNTRAGVSNVPLIFDLTTGTLTVTARKIDEAELVFKGLNVQWNFQNLNYKATAITCYRSNTVFRNINFHIPNNIDWNDNGKTSAGGSAFTAQYCCNVTIDNFIGEAIRDGYSGSTYIWYVERVAHFKVFNSTMLVGWHCFGTNGVKDWIVRDSIINAVDVHIGAGDIYCDNVQFLGKWGIQLSYGVGRVNVKDCIMRRASTERDSNTNALVYMTNGYTLRYEGTINIYNLLVDGAAYGFALVRDAYSEGSGGYTFKDIQCPRLYVDKVRFINTPATRLYGYFFDNIANLSNTLNTNSRYLYLPSEIEIKNVFFETKGDSLQFRSVGLEFQTDSTWVKADTKISLYNVQGVICSGFDAGFDSSLTQYKETDILEMIVNANRSDFNIYIDIDNCTGFVKAQGITRSIKIRNSTVQYDVLYGGSDYSRVCQSMNLHNCKIYYYGYASQTRPQLFGLVMNNCELVSLKVSGTYQPITELVIGTYPIKKLLGNVFIDTAVTDAAANKYWKYVNSGSYKVPTVL